VNSDIRIKLSFRNHRKTEKLRRRLGEGGVLALLWLWMDAAENRPEGVLTGYDEEDIAIAAGWSGEAKEFISALLDTGWMEKVDEGTYALHDYQEHQPYASGAEERKIKGRYNAYLGHGNLAKARELEDQYPWLAQAKEKTGEPQGQAASPQGATHGDPTGPPMAPPPDPPRDSHGGPHAPSPTPTQPPRTGATKASSTSSRTRGSNAAVGSAPPTRSDPPTPPVFQIPMINGPDGQERSYPVHREDIDHWAKLYPALDVEQSIRNMLGWLEGRPEKRSATEKGVKQRLNSWLKRDQDSGGTPGGKRPPSGIPPGRAGANLQRLDRLADRARLAEDALDVGGET